MKASAKHLTAVTLGLRGKSPCIAPDYLLVNRHIKLTLLKPLKKIIKEFYGDNPTNSPDYARNC